MNLQLFSVVHILHLVSVVIVDSPCGSVDLEETSGQLRRHDFDVTQLVPFLAVSQHENQSLGRLVLSFEQFVAVSLVEVVNADIVHKREEVNAQEL